LKAVRQPLSSGIDITKSIRDKVQSVIYKNYRKNQLSVRKISNDLSQELMEPEARRAAKSTLRNDG